MKKLTYLIAILAIGLLGFTHVHAQKPGQYVLNDNGYHIAIIDKDGNIKLVDVATKDAPWTIRFNPSSTLAGIVDKRTSSFRKNKREIAQVLSATIVALLSGTYLFRENMKERERKKDWKDSKKLFYRPKFYDEGTLKVYRNTHEKNKTIIIEPQTSTAKGSSDTKTGWFTEWLADLPLLHWLSAIYKKTNMTQIFRDSMLKHTQHLDRNLQLNVVETGGFTIDPLSLSRNKE